MISGRPAFHIRLPRYSPTHLLASLLVLFVTTAFLENTPAGRVIQGVLLTIVVLSALVAVSGRRTLWIGSALVATALAGQWAPDVNTETLCASIAGFLMIGFGDITPVSRVAGMPAVMPAITGMFYVAVLISRLVSIHASNAIQNPKEPPR